jgi:aminoglycoside phosphotransferase (APT) family kinase protein
MAALSQAAFGELTARVATAGITGLRPLPGGASSLTYAGTQNGAPVVVKVAPPGIAPTLNRDVLRQARIIRALGPTAVPVPEVWWEDPGNPPDVPPLFVMTFLDGASVEPLFDLDTADEDPAAVAERLRDAARVLAALHRVDPAAAGLGSEPVITLADEVARWSRLLETVDPALVPDWQGVAGALRSSMPESWSAAVCHGDFRLGNLLATGQRITAVIDWEIWSAGDPRVDAGWFLINSDAATYRRATAYAGTTPAPSELAEIYAGVLGRPVPDLTWFQGLACFKSAATWSLIVKHNRRRSAPDPDVEAMAIAVPTLLARGAEFANSVVPQHFSPNGG